MRFRKACVCQVYATAYDGAQSTMRTAETVGIEIADSLGAEAEHKPLRYNLAIDMTIWIDMMPDSF